jgi:hypothetical protein
MQTITLTPYDSSLIGKYIHTDTVIVLCDTTAGAFSFTLPDFSLTADIRFVIKNVGVNDVTVNTVTGQRIDSLSSVVLRQWKSIEVISDKTSRYILINQNNQLVF